MAKVQHCHFVNLTKVLLFHTSTWKACFKQNEWSQNRVHVCLNSINIEIKVKTNTNILLPMFFYIAFSMYALKKSDKILRKSFSLTSHCNFLSRNPCICKRFAVLTSQLKVQGKWCLLQLKLSHSDQHTVKWYFGRKDTKVRKIIMRIATNIVARPGLCK